MGKICLQALDTEDSTREWKVTGVVEAEALIPNAEGMSRCGEERRHPQGLRKCYIRNNTGRVQEIELPPGVLSSN